MEGDGHINAHHPDDQWCHSESSDVYLSRVPLVQLDAGTWEQDSMRTYLGRERFEAQAYVCLVRGEFESSSVNLTPEEAIKLGEALIRDGRLALESQAGPLSERLARAAASE